MKLQIISREIIKPSSPTPPHLRTHKLSIFDQLAPDVYFPVILFYSRSSIKSSHHLKHSLSEILTHYYPFAGQVKDDFSIDCDDHGVIFIEANVASDMSEILKKPEIDLLENLLPCQPSESLTAPVNLAVQVNRFGCGGIAISICFKHIIADASAAANFIKNWAAVACGLNHSKDVVFDSTAIFPPNDSIALVKSLYNRSLSAESITKRFVFHGDKIAALREKISQGSFLDRPTRFEAVSALIWAGVIGVVRERDKIAVTHLIRTPVNLRKRMNPPLPQESMGNIFQVAMANWSMENEIDYNNLAGKIHESVRMIDDNYVRKLHGGGEYLNQFKNGDAGLLKSNTSRIFAITSWCTLPFYKADFGFGKPAWLSTAMRYKDVAILFDTCDGEGIEAWVALGKEDMALFKQEPGILAYASFNPSI
ncbi:vinorine synthase-like [Melia azedarach]|uniref:Vinorine synthase-like n=1 Tax=Melia azedarach TaxID=155640 RepID=A0ACC1XMR2_MELAZ|nr:vinorine synthase-like [Melia azedarach]